MLLWMRLVASSLLQQVSTLIGYIMPTLSQLISSIRAHNYIDYEYNDPLKQHVQFEVDISPLSVYFFAANRRLDEAIDIYIYIYIYVCVCVCVCYMCICVYKNLSFIYVTFISPGMLLFFNRPLSIQKLPWYWIDIRKSESSDVAVNRGLPKSLYMSCTVCNKFITCSLFLLFAYIIE